MPSHLQVSPQAILLSNHWQSLHAEDIVFYRDHIQIATASILTYIIRSISHTITVYPNLTYNVFAPFGVDVRRHRDIGVVPVTADSHPGIDVNPATDDIPVSVTETRMHCGLCHREFNDGESQVHFECDENHLFHRMCAPITALSSDECPRCMQLPEFQNTLGYDDDSDLGYDDDDSDSGYDDDDSDSGNDDDSDSGNDDDLIVLGETESEVDFWDSE